MGLTAPTVPTAVRAAGRAAIPKAPAAGRGVARPGGGRPPLWPPRGLPGGAGCRPPGKAGPAGGLKIWKIKPGKFPEGVPLEA